MDQIALAIMLRMRTEHQGLFHERMERCIEELGIPAIEFIHPMEEEIIILFSIRMRETGPILFWRVRLA